MAIVDNTLRLRVPAGQRDPHRVVVRRSQDKELDDLRRAQQLRNADVSRYWWRRSAWRRIEDADDSALQEELGRVLILGVSSLGIEFICGV